MEASVTSFTLPNGLTVIYSHRPQSACVALSFRVIAGSQYELPHEIGVAHFLEHLVSDGTEKYPDEKAIAGLIDERGGFRNAYTGMETVEYVVKLLREDAEVACDYLAEIVMRPLLRDTAITKQKQIIEQEILRFKNNPEQFAPRLLYAALFPGIRRGGLVTGDIADIQKLSRAVIHAYWQRTHVARNAVLAVCGDLPLTEVRALAERYFGNMVSGEQIALLNFTAPPATEPIREVRPDIKQAELAIGFQAFAANDPDHYAAHLLQHILTSGKTSRLRYEIREKRALAYSVSGHHSAGRTSGQLTLHVGLAEKNIPECLEIIRHELKDLATNLLSPEERQKAFRYIKTNRAFQFENSLAEAAYHSNQWCLTGTLPPAELAVYAAVAADAEALRAAAARLFSSPPAMVFITAK
jgi:predicted Zn-dependent peptidase